MIAARLSGAIVALLAAIFIILALGSYGAMEAARSLPTGGVTDGGPHDAVPTGAQADKVLAARAEMQQWRGASGPAPGTPAAGPGNQDIPSAPVPSTKPEPQPWVTQAPLDISLYRDRSFVDGITTLPNHTTDVLLQAAGREFRRFHNTQLTVGGGIGLLGVIGLLGAFLLLRGRVRLKEGFSGQWVPRFDGYERFNHWMTAISFIMVALTGLILLYGEYFIRPIIGAPAYSGFASATVWVHLGFALPFIIGVITMIVLWLGQNGFTKADFGWLARAGGLIFPSRNTHAGRFNAGQKVIFWLVVIGAATLAVTGVFLMFPFYWFGIAGMQLALIVHGIAALVMIAVILGHIYIGTVGEEGAFNAMWTGEVDRNWAREHHDLWVPEERDGKGKKAGEAHPGAHPAPAE